MHNAHSRLHKEIEMRNNNILNTEKTLLNLYSSTMSGEKEGNVKIELYNLLKDEKDILEDLEHDNTNVIWL